MAKRGREGKKSEPGQLTEGNDKIFNSAYRSNEEIPSLPFSALQYVLQLCVYFVPFCFVNAWCVRSAMFNVKGLFPASLSLPFLKRAPSFYLACSSSLPSFFGCKQEDPISAKIGFALWSFLHHSFVRSQS